MHQHAQDCADCNTMACALQEICSFLKGSSEAMDSPNGKLTLEAYLEVHGRLLGLIFVYVIRARHQFLQVAVT